MNEIILIRPKADISAWDIPLGLLYIGTVLDDEGYLVTIIDAGRQYNYKKLISRKLDNAFLVGITCQTSEVASAIEISDYIKSISDVPIIWGGWHPILYPEQVCSDPSVNYVCLGEGEYTMLELARALESGKPVTNIDGLAFKENGTVKVNPYKRYVDLEALPPINYGLIDILRYVRTTNYSDNGGRCVIYQSSRGCRHRCKFCNNEVIKNHIFRAKSPEKVVDEIQLLIAKYDIDYVAFIDDNFYSDIERAQGIFEEILYRNINVKLFTECRVDYIKQGLVDMKTLDLAQRSGLSKLALGAESGSQRILDMIDKGITVEHILESASILSSFNIKAEYIFMIGLPGETTDERMATLQLADKIYRSCPNSLPAFCLFTPYPRFELTEYLIQAGLLKQPETLRQWADRSTRAIYSNRSQIKPWFEKREHMGHVLHYARLAYHFYPYRITKNGMINFFKAPWKYRGIILVLIAQWRINNLCFHIPIDKAMYNIYKYLEDRLKRLFA
jgi:radical SAM superfamily enzyme YgiQ (UPF0313 family)